MWRINEHGLLFAHGKPLSRDLRLLIINKIILHGGDVHTGIFPGKYTDIVHSLGVSSAVVSNIWKRFWQNGTISPRKNQGGNPSHLSEGDLQYVEYLKKQQPSISYNEIIERLNEFGDLPTVWPNINNSLIRGSSTSSS
jgi:transposase